VRDVPVEGLAGFGGPPECWFAALSSAILLLEVGDDSLALSAQVGVGRAGSLASRRRWRSRGARARRSVHRWASGGTRRNPPRAGLPATLGVIATDGDANAAPALRVAATSPRSRPSPGWRCRRGRGRAVCPGLADPVETSTASNHLEAIAARAASSPQAVGRIVLDVQDGGHLDASFSSRPGWQGGAAGTTAAPGGAPPSTSAAGLLRRAHATLAPLQGSP
jgi:hypothetical protein